MPCLSLMRKTIKMCRESLHLAYLHENILQQQESKRVPLQQVAKWPREVNAKAHHAPRPQGGALSCSKDWWTCVGGAPTSSSTIAGSRQELGTVNPKGRKQSTRYAAVESRGPGGGSSVTRMLPGCRSAHDVIRRSENQDNNRLIAAVIQELQHICCGIAVSSAKRTAPQIRNAHQ